MEKKQYIYLVFSYGQISANVGVQPRPSHNVCDNISGLSVSAVK